MSGKRSIGRGIGEAAFSPGKSLRLPRRREKLTEEVEKKTTSSQFIN